MGQQPVAVTGLGCIGACGLSVSENMDTLFGAAVQPVLPRRFSCEHEKEYPVFALPERFFEQHPSKPELFDSSRYAEVAALEAVADSGVTLDELQGLRVGVCLGTTVGASLNCLEFYREHRHSGASDPRQIDRFLNSNPAAYLASRLGLTGPAQTVVNACSSGTDAIGIGAAWIRQGLCDVVLAGGADELTPVTYNGFISLQIVSTSPCMPFDQDRSGLTLGEGAGVLLLESDERVQNRGASLKGGIHGYGTCADAYHLTAPKPDGAGLRSAIESAMMQAGLSSSEVGFVNVHGTATANNDVAEAGVLTDMLPGVPLSATKGYTGHTLGAAGAIEAVYTLECLRLQKVPASQGFSCPDSALGVNPVSELTSLQAEYGLSQSLAFGGNNSALVLGRAVS